MRLAVEIEGTTPLLMNRFTDEAQHAATAGTRSSISNGTGEPQEIAERALYRSIDGETVIIPQPNLFRCILDAGKYFKVGRNKVTTQKSSIIPACVEIEGVEIPLIHDKPWEVDARPVRIPSSGGRIIRYRPIFWQWGLAFHVDLDETIIAAKLFREIVDAAGKRIGLGDFRPDCKGPYGRFVVTRWEVPAAVSDLAS